MEFPELPGVHELAGEDDERREQRFTRIVALAIVLTTLAAAVTAYAQASALRDHDDAASRATALASAALASGRQSDQAAQMLVARYGLALQQRTRAADELQRATFAPGAATSAAEEQRWRRVAALTDRDTNSIAAAYGLDPVRKAAITGPDADRFFPQRYIAVARLRSYELGARRDGANQKAEEAHSQVGRYTLSLTVFAVAVFLLGYSLTPHARRRRALFAGAAAGFVLFGVVWSVVTATRTPEEPEPSAARAFAAGRVAYDSEHYSEAVHRLDEALADWPEYGAGYALRAKAEFAAGSPQLDIPLSLTTPKALEASVADQTRALDHDAEDSGLIVEHGFQLLALGLRRDDDGKIEDGLRFSDEAREARPTDPVPAYNAAAALLALGRDDAARKAYAEGVERTVFADERHKQRRNDVAAYEFYLGEALTDLDSIAAARPRLRGAVAAAKRQIVAPVTRAAYAEPLEAEKHQPPATGSLRLAAGPGFTELTILRPRDIGPEADLSAQWYFEAPRGRGWSVLPDVSGAINDQLVEERDGSLTGRGAFLSATGNCLSPGGYRLELYVDGRLVAAVQRHLAFPALDADRLRELGLAFCRPADWRPIAGAPGLLDGATSPDRSAGMLVFSVSREVAGARTASRGLSVRIASAALRRFAGRLPAGLHPTGPADAPFMDLRGRLVRAYRYPGGSALLGAGATHDGAQLLVAVAYGRPGFMRGAGRAVFGSLAQEN